ncbi:peroxide stress protein YaaA [Porticoccaceae bacterium]|nr:peroxide stress protein YaaA [Porticoccaceae bacterium]MDB9949170.1 peroxide stress protein YaaA [Porticoccaceae bacterium]
MLVVISPAKKLDYSSSIEAPLLSQPALLDHAEELALGLKTLAPQDVSSLMHLSDKLGALNYARFQEWQTPCDANNARAAVLAFKGDVYQGLDAESMSAEDLFWAQDHLRILSGLYGVLRPLDLMQAYRLEMGTKFANPRGKDLYQFWGDVITAELNRAESSVLVNLASNEYFKSVRKKDISARIVTPVFMDKKDDKYKIISFYAKKARGLMSRYIIQKRITQIEQINQFDSDGYVYNAALSEADAPVFLRG